MLRELQISNFAIIDRLGLNFDEGLNVLTGETGAGKSIIVDALELLFGARATVDQIRSGCDQAVVEVLIELPDSKAVRGPLWETGLLAEDEGELTLRRIISRSGKGRMYVNAHPVTLSLLQEIGRGLIDIHGQHDHQSLLYSNHQLDLLDGYAKLLPLREDYARCYEDWRRIEKELEGIEKAQQDKERRMEFLKFQIEEIRSLDLRTDEDRDLQRERDILSHSGKLADHADSAYQLLYGAEASALASLGRVEEHLEAIRAIDSRFTEALTGWSEAMTHLKEVSKEIRQYKDRIDHDPERLQTIEDRLYQIGKIKKKYGASVEGVLAYLANAMEELDALEHQEETLSALKSALREKEQRVQQLARQLTELRVKAAKRFRGEVEKQLRQLGMERIGFGVRIDPESGGPDSKGADRVQFTITSGPGEEAKPLSRIASGGELSRVMLAIKSILADVDRVPILIFDEVDSGVGGAVAEAVGRRLKAISRTHQVFCITHLHQIAMLADGHYQVEKADEKGKTVTRTRRLDSSERIQEIARMMGGKEITPITLQHAQELLARSGASS